MNNTLPGISVCVPAYKSEATIKRALLSADRVLRGQKWALFLCVDGDFDDTSGIAKKIPLSANVVHIEQFPKASSIHEASNRAADFARLASKEFPFFTFLDADDEMLEGKVELLRIAATSGLPAVLGGAICSDHTGRRWEHDPAFNWRTHQNAAHLAVFNSSLLQFKGEPYNLFDPEAHDDILNDVVMWHRLARFHRVSPGCAKSAMATLYNMNTGSWSLRGATQIEKWKKTEEWVDKHNLHRPSPAVIAIIAAGKESADEAELSIESARLAGIGTKFVVATDDMDRFEDMGVEAIPIESILAQSRASMVHYKGPDWCRNIFLYAAAKTRLAAMLVDRGGVLVSDSDIVHLQPLPPMPEHPASCIDSRGPCFDDYGTRHWGLHSTGLMWFPNQPGIMSFIDDLEAETMKNLRLYRSERSETSAPGNGMFAEQGAFDSMITRWIVDSLPPGNNITPSAIRSYKNHLSGMDGPLLLDEVDRLCGLYSRHGIWWNGWPVRQIHAHLSRETWIPVFNRWIRRSLESFDSPVLDLVNIKTGRCT